MKNFYVVFFVLVTGIICGQDIQDVYKQESKQVYLAKKKLDWLSLIKLAKIAHEKQENTIWEQGIIQWAEEIVLQQRISVGGYHLASYYNMIGDKNKAFYWKNIGDFWKKESIINSKNKG